MGFLVQLKKAKVDATSAAPAVVNSTKPAAVVKPAAAAAAPVGSNVAKPPAQEFSWNKKKLDPKDFMFSKLKNQVRREMPFPPTPPEKASKEAG